MSWSCATQPAVLWQNEFGCIPEQERVGLSRLFPQLERFHCRSFLHCVIVFRRWLPWPFMQHWFLLSCRKFLSSTWGWTGIFTGSFSLLSISACPSPSLLGWGLLSCSGSGLSASPDPAAGTCYEPMTPAQDSPGTTACVACCLWRKCPSLVFTFACTLPQVLLPASGKSSGLPGVERPLSSEVQTQTQPVCRVRDGLPPRGSTNSFSSVKPSVDDALVMRLWPWKLRLTF